MTPVLVLVGPPGAGKTTVGRLAAHRLGVGFRDTDDDVAQAVGKSISEIFVDEGENRFRALERDAVAQALREHAGVVSLGGGAVLAAETRALLKNLDVVLLVADLASVTARVGLSRNRPILALNPRATLRLLLQERMPYYREVARHVVDTSGRPPSAVVDDVLAVLGTATT